MTRISFLSLLILTKEGVSKDEAERGKDENESGTAKKYESEGEEKDKQEVNQENGEEVFLCVRGKRRKRGRTWRARVRRGKEVPRSVATLVRSDSVTHKLWLPVHVLLRISFFVHTPRSYSPMVVASRVFWDGHPRVSRRVVRRELFAQCVMSWSQHKWE